MKKLIIALAFILSAASPAFSQQLIYKGATVYKCLFKMVDSTDTNHAAGKTGLTVTFTISKDGGAFAASHAATITEISSGWYKALLDSNDTPTDGLIAYHATGTGADPSDGFCGQVTEVDMRGLTPDAAAIASALGDESCALHGTASTLGEGICQSRIYDALVLNASVVRSGTAQAATSTTLTLDSSASAIDNTYRGNKVLIYSGTGIAQTRHITGYVGSTKVATLDSAWITNPNSASSFILLPDDRSQRAVPAATAFKWDVQFFDSDGTVVTTGTPACTRSIDQGSFGSTTNSPSTVNSDGISHITISTADTTATDNMVLKCTLTGAGTYYNQFKIQP